MPERPILDRGEEGLLGVCASQADGEDRTTAVTESWALLGRSWSTAMLSYRQFSLF